MLANSTVNQQILAAIKFGVSQNKVIWRLIKVGVSPRPVYAVYDRRIFWRRQILAKTRNSPNIIARQNLLIYSNWFITQQVPTKRGKCDARIMSNASQS